MGDQAEDVISHNNLSQYTDEQWINRDQQKLLFVLGLITNANRAAMILAWIDKKEWGGAKSHTEDGLTAHEKYEKRHVQSKEKNNSTLLETDVEHTSYLSFFYTGKIFGK